MSEISQHPLQHLASISVCGHDAQTFLQGQCTQDITKIPSFGALPGAFCSAKGRVVSNVWIHSVQDDQTEYQLICHKSAAPLLFKHLKMYVPFFRGTQMTLVDQDTLNMVGHMGSGDRPGFALNDQMSIELHHEAADSDRSAASLWQIEEIKNGILWLDEHQLDQWVPQNINLDSLNAISFSKGCYTGQEVVARLHYKGSSKKRLYAIKADAKLTTSHSIAVNGKTVGNLLQCAQDEQYTYGLAVIKTDSVDGPLYIAENEQVQIELLHSFN